MPGYISATALPFRCHGHRRTSLMSDRSCRSKMDSDGDGYNERRYICAVTPLSSADPNDLLPLPVAMFHILVAVADQDRHGYAIMQDVAARTNGALKLSPGTPG